MLFFALALPLPSFSLLDPKLGRSARPRRFALATLLWLSVRASGLPFVALLEDDHRCKALPHAGSSTLGVGVRLSVEDAGVLIPRRKGRRRLRGFGQVALFVCCGAWKDEGGALPGGNGRLCVAGEAAGEAGGSGEAGVLTGE